MAGATGLALEAQEQLLPAQPLSPGAQQTYGLAQDKLVQIRSLRSTTNTQSSIGSGFYVGNQGLILTNFHVISDLALEPERHRGVRVSVQGQEQELELLAFDVTNDLAVLREAAPSGQAPLQGFALRPQAEELVQGERIYALGNPLDVGFAITEGNYNGLVQRSFYPRLFFGGVLNAGMSGGPALDTQGRVLGVNVAKRLDGEQISFLVPLAPVRALLEKVAEQTEQAQLPLGREHAYAHVNQQLQQHQQEVVQRWLQQPLQMQAYGQYRVPLPDTQWARCWGEGRESRAREWLDFEKTECNLQTGVDAGSLGRGMGRVELRYEVYDGGSMSALAFARQLSRQWSRQWRADHRGADQTTAQCQEDFVQLQQLPVRAVTCLTAYRKLPGLYNLVVLVVTNNQERQAVIGRLHVRGVSMDSAMQLNRHYLTHFSWQEQP